ncbi:MULTISPECIES: AAA family ATPase [unclassified Streptomyces]|uniref:AAA family ATPase n=1 Tax=unclassified Streptomyces TaxID=2593676 RepID=UPI000DC7AE5D|nr:MULTISPECIES: AAA family ATPase [unclassified Streptomyces]AWZ08475.1 phosphotransferase [Streptomyces sp. ICC4]AWZ16251.1 phosphotransferase [Streptomyces sp. ICC1]
MSLDLVPVDREPAAGAVLLTGIPGSGKSTVAAALAGRFRMAAHIEVDALQQMIVSGGQWPSPAANAEADRQIFLRARNACLLADSFVRAGFIPVLDDVVVRRSHLDFYRMTLAAVPLHIVVLAPGPATAWRRNQAREKALAVDWSPLDEAMRSELGQQGIWIDNAAQTVEETVEAILSATGLASSSEVDQPLR